MIALVLPWWRSAPMRSSTFKEKPPGEPPAGVVAHALPFWQNLQAFILPVSAPTRAALRIEAVLKSGDEAASGRGAGPDRRPRSPFPCRNTSMRRRPGSGTPAKSSWWSPDPPGPAHRPVAPAPVELQTEDNLTVYAQYLGRIVDLLHLGGPPRTSPFAPRCGPTRSTSPWWARCRATGPGHGGPREARPRQALPLTLNAAMGPATSPSPAPTASPDGSSVPFMVEVF